MTYAKARTGSTGARGANPLALLGVSAALALAGAFPAGAQNLEERVAALERETVVNENRVLKWHLSGYAAAGLEFSKTEGATEGTTSTFTPARFAPIFHFLYNDVALFQAEPELSVAEDGGTELELEYASIALLLHDRFSLVIGKFLSPIGQFQERLHPAWTNKLPNAPAGFGHHGGIAPLTDLGLQVRGGAPLGGMLLGYTVYVSNGPQVVLHHGRLEVEHEATTSTRDEKTFGGRLSLIPVPHLEFGVSAISASKLSGEAGLLTQPDLSLVGMDGAYTQGPWDVRFEYIGSTLDSFTDPEGDVAPETKPSLWYVQAAYQLGGPWEPVIRYGESQYEAWDTAGNTLVQRKTKRLSLGVNYLFAPSLIAKFAYETDDLDWTQDQERFTFQVAYGF